MITIVMGVSGSGKTTIGTMLADALGCAYLEGDLLHSPASIEAMTRGIPLTDEDRAPWLAAIRERMVTAFEAGRDLVVGCSALKHSYRAVLSDGLPVAWVYLKGSPELIRARLLSRRDHFFEAEMLESQIETLEEPEDAIVIDASLAPSVIVEQLVTALSRSPDVRVFADIDELSVSAAEAAAERMRDTANAAGRCSVVLSGGHTPRDLYHILAVRFRDVVPWEHVHVFWCDERYVPHDDPRSNYRMAREALLDHVPCPPGNIHPMPTSYDDPADAAREYEQSLTHWFAGAQPRFDLVILGMGADGHTASLFPGTTALRERTRWVAPVIAEADPPSRLTLTLPLLTAASLTWLLAAGSGKAAAARAALYPPADAASPAALVQRGYGRVVWWLDRAAAAHIDAVAAGSPRSSLRLRAAARGGSDAAH